MYDRINQQKQTDQQRAGCRVETCYWGVVVTTRLHPGAEGCYLLKTTESRHGDCSCTYYSLIRIGRGSSLRSQETSSWLSPA